MAILPPLNIESLRKLAQDFEPMRVRIAGLNVLTGDMGDALQALPDMAEYRTPEELRPLCELVESLQHHCEMQQATLVRHWNDLNNANVRLAQASLALRGEILRTQGGQR